MLDSAIFRNFSKFTFCRFFYKLVSICQKSAEFFNPKPSNWPGQSYIILPARHLRPFVFHILISNICWWEINFCVKLVMLMKKIVLFLLAVLSAAAMSAQTVKISGTVSDSDGNPFLISCSPFQFSCSPTAFPNNFLTFTDNL